MIPQIKVCCDRLLAGEKVYAPMPQIWDGMLPTYLPAMWLPYVPLEWLNADVRWTNVFFLLFSFGCCFFLIDKRKNTLAILIPMLLICWRIFDFLFVRERTFIAFTEESVVIGYYLLLGYALIRKNPWLTGIAIALCLLSRYTLLGWIPVYLIYCWLFESKIYAMKIFITVFTLFVLLFLLPFGIWQPSYFIEVPGIYLNHAIVLKGHNSDVFINNISFSALFSQSQMNILHRIGVITVLFMPILLLGLFLLLRNKPNQWRSFFGLCSLKLTMILFYSFILIPFYYLFFVPVFFSLPIILQAMRSDSTNSQPQIE